MKKILMVTMSDHTSFQDGVFSMYENLKDRYKVTTLTIKIRIIQLLGIAIICLLMLLKDRELLKTHSMWRVFIK